MATESRLSSLPEEKTAEIRQQVRRHDDQVADKVRQRVLANDEYCCQVKGCYGQQRDGTAELLVQPIADLPAEGDRYAASNLETRCLECACWVALMPQPADLPPRLRHQIDDLSVERNWVEILQYLHRHGPAGPADITEAVTLESTPGVRHALYSLMGLDVRHESVTQQVVYRDYRNRTYGLASQIPADRRTRGRIPADPDTLRSRVLDELVRRLHDHLAERLDCPRPLIAAIVDRGDDQIRRMLRRAQAMQFPFERWADTARSADEETALRRVVDQLAELSDELSRETVASEVAEVCAANDATNLAELLRTRQRTYGQRTLADGPEPSTDVAERAAEPTDEAPGEGPADAQGRADATDQVGTNGQGEPTGDGTPGLTRLESLFADDPSEATDE